MNNKRLLILELALLIMGVIFIFKIQFAIPNLYDADSYLHIRMAQFLQDRGIERTFPWTRYSVFFQNFSDKDFLFHCLLVPFTWFSDIFSGAKYAAAFFFSSLFLVFYWFLRKWGQREFVPLLLIVFFSSFHFWFILSSLRPFPMILIYSILAVYFLVECRYFWIFLITVLYALTHVSFPIMAFYVAAAESVRFFSEKQVCRKNIYAVFIGMTIGVLLHPYFPNNLRIFYLNGILVPFYALGRDVLGLGGEFLPASTRDILYQHPFIFLGFAAVLCFYIFASSPKVRTSLVTRILFVFTLMYLFLGLSSRRFFVHAWPMALLFYGGFLKDLFSVHKPAKKNIAWLYGSALAVFFMIGVFVWKNDVPKTLNSVQVTHAHYEDFGNFMRNNLPKGELIFHSNWSDSELFIGIDPAHSYFVTLDPVYMYAYDSGLFLLYRDVAYGRYPDPYTVLKNTFQVRYGYVGKNYFSGLIYQIKRDNHFLVLKEDGLGILFYIKE